MLRQGPIPRAVHGILGYSDEGAATAVSIVAGIVVLIGAAVTKCFPTSVIKSLPVAGHLTLDFTLVAALIAAPFLFGFSDDGTPTAFFIVAAVLALLVTLATRWLPQRG